MGPERSEDLLERLRELQDRLEEAEETLRALHAGEVDAVVVSGPEGESVYTLKGADTPYRIMVEAMTEGALTLTRDGLILFSNEQFASMLGMPLERVIGSPIQGFIAAEDAPLLAALLAGGAGKAEVQFRTDTGRPVPVQLSANVLAFGETEGICLIVTDLTEQKRNEEIVASERLARSILDQAGGAILVTDIQGKITRASRAAVHMARATVLLQQFDDVFGLRTTSDAKDCTFEEILARVRREGIIANLPAKARTPDGRAMDVLMSAALLTGADSEPLGCIIILSDVTDLRRAEEALHESESRLRTLSDNLPEGAIHRYCQDRDGRVRFEFISAGIEGLSGVPAAEIIQDAAALHSAILPKDLERLEAAMARSREELTPLEMELRLTHRVTGEVRWLLRRSMPRRRPDGSTVWDGVQLDITGRKRSEEELRLTEDRLRQAQKMESIGVLAGGIAHDFNNLLTGVIGNASLVLDTLPETDYNRPMLEAVLSAAKRTADLTRQLLAYAGKGRFYSQRVNLSKSVRGMTDLLRASVPANVEIGLDLQEGMPAVEADPSQIEQVIMNLVLNASESIGDGSGHISLRTRTRSVDATWLAQSGQAIPVGTYISLEVQDTGAGMDEETKSRIFEPFYTTKFTGRGLGLAAVQGIVRAHKGAVLVRSHPGEGSLFTVLLPAAGAAAEEHLEVPAEAQAASGHGTILVVDDEETVRLVAKAVLEQRGYKVLLAANGVEAIDIFSRAPDQITAVVLDLTMPLLSGPETLGRLRAIRPDVPVLLSSGYNEIDVLRRFTGQRPAGFVGKPYSAADLGAKVRSVCTRS